MGWIAALLVALAGLLVYNFGYLPQKTRILRQREENAMWTREVQELTQRLDSAGSEPETAIIRVLLFDELFTAPESFELSSEGQEALAECVTDLQKTTGTIEIIGHTDNSPVPAGLKPLLPTAWEYAGAKAAAVARALEGWSVAPGRMRVTSAGSTSPRADNSTAEGRTRNRRVELLVRK